ncbi:MAG: class I SAM-dependent methyltransferase, partial [Thaumarchaeota archaeon]|nr:class I SAM-dependent methyltransferase [Nitrososphaerota archaeon]
MMDPLKYIQSKWVYGYHRPIEAIKKLDLEAGSSLLILGSGLGKTATMAAKRFKCNVIGAEFFPFFVDKANKRAQNEGLADRVNFVPIDRDKPY